MALRPLPDRLLRVSDPLVRAAVLLLFAERELKAKLATVADELKAARLAAVSEKISGVISELRSGRLQ